MKGKGKYIFLGCMFLGIAIGKKFNETAFGTMLGIGVGFILQLFFNHTKNED